MIEMEPITTPRQIDTLAKLAKEIWQEHYGVLLGDAQIAYMLDQFQSAKAIRAQLEEGYQYFFLLDDGTIAGYAGVRADEDALFLSKLYIRADFRRRGIARETVAFLEGMAAGMNLPRIWLTVNRGNSGSIAAYEALGFHTLREEATPIGGGFVMDDYIMAKAL
ncbi:MAG: GNAT family N-acetyltransferase [Eubacteriales bacterium]|nr:GNAT family N-acetyltransferase [Eubacteriales bacterium]